MLWAVDRRAAQSLMPQSLNARKASPGNWWSLFRRLPVLAASTLFNPLALGGNLPSSESAHSRCRSSSSRVVEQPFWWRGGMEEVVGPLGQSLAEPQTASNSPQMSAEPHWKGIGPAHN